MRFEKQRTRVAVLGEKLTPIRTLGGGLTLAGVMLDGWVRQCAAESNSRKASRGVRLTCRRLT